jgi:signal transduction histidine kinase
LDYVRDVTAGAAVSGALLTAVVLLHIRIYDDSRKRLVELDKLKSEFYRNMHHEMKTPLTVIISYINVVEAMIDLDRMDTERMREKINGAQREIISLARLLENTIDLASAEVARYYMEPLDFADLLRKCSGVFRAKMQGDGNDLTLNIPDNLPRVLGNAELLRRVVYNLVGNACKHTKNGEITVGLRRTGDFLEASVRDTGEGIDPESLPHVWERGVTSNGTGYGLSIAKAIVEEIHGGVIGIESEPGKGTLVTFSLPVSAGGGVIR